MLKEQRTNMLKVSVDNKFFVKFSLCQIYF